MTRQQRALQIAEETFARLHGPRATWSRADREAHDLLLAEITAQAQESTTTERRGAA